MENLPFSQEEVLSFTFDFSKLSQNLKVMSNNQLAQISETENLKRLIQLLLASKEENAKAIEELKRSSSDQNEIVKKTADTIDSLDKKFSLVREAYSNIMKGFEEKLNNVVENIYNEMKIMISEQDKKFDDFKIDVRRKIRNIQISSGHNPVAQKESETVKSELMRHETMAFESLNERVEFIEKTMKKLMIEDIVNESSESELNERVNNANLANTEEKSDVLFELNTKYLSIINEVSKLREKLHYLSSSSPKSNPSDHTSYVPYITRISTLESLVNGIQLRLQERHSSNILSYDIFSNSTSNIVLPKETILPEIIKETSVSRPTLSESPLHVLPKDTNSKSAKGHRKRNSLQDLQILVEKPKAVAPTVHNYSEDIQLIKRKIFELSEELKNKSDKTSITVVIHEAIAAFKNEKDIIELCNEDKLRSLESKINSNLFKSEKEKKTKDQNMYKGITQEEFSETFLEFTNKINHTVQSYQNHIYTEIETLTNDIKNIEAKATKAANTSQVFDIRTQDLMKRTSQIEESLNQISGEVEKIQDRYRKNTLKNTEELEKTVAYLRELENLRTNVQEILQKMQEGSKLHKRDYNTILELRQMVESKLSKEEIEQKVDKNELKKMFRLLARKVISI